MASASTSSTKVKAKNEHLPHLKTDFLYHLDISITNTKDPTDIRKYFGDVKFICLGGTDGHTLELAKFMNNFVYDGKAVSNYIDIGAACNRYEIYKVGQVLCCSHGIGSSSVSIVLHEIFKLLHYAGCHDPIFLRLGTSGGLGVEAGTVIVSQEIFNGYLRGEYELAILGNKVTRLSQLDRNIMKAIMTCSDPTDEFKTIEGNTMSAECFYEGQGRLDGAFCNYSEKDKLGFLEKLHLLGIKSIEMEALAFAAMTHHMGVKAGVICVAIVNRLTGDQIVLSREQLDTIQKRPYTIAGRYIKRVIDEMKHKKRRRM